MEASGVCSLIAVHRLLLAAASLGAEHGLQDVQASVVAGEGLQKRDSVVVAHGLRCSEAWSLPGPGFESTSPALADGLIH